MYFLRFIIFNLLIIILSYQNSLIAKDNLYYYEEALKIEKISPLMAIPLYEEFLNSAPEKQFYTPTINRLFDLYYKNKKFEDIILLDANYKLDKNRKEKANKLYKEISKNIKIPENVFLEILHLSRKTDPISRDRILELYYQNQNDFILNFIFALKFKIGDFDTLKYLIDEINAINPVLKLFYLVKTNHPSTEENIYDVSSLSELNDDQKMEILFLYGIYYQRQKDYPQSTRFFLTADSYLDSTKEKYASRSLLEASKSLFLNGSFREACSLISNKTFYLQNESDEFMILFCDKKTSQDLRNYKKIFSFLAEKEGGAIFQKYLQSLKKHDKKNKK